MRIGYNAGFSGDETDLLNDHTDDVLFIDGKMHKLDITMVEKVNA